MVYPGYVPEPGIKYRVFHYGLEFSVGNWSFDKAKWREVDMVNRCWAKFPEPPDPSTLDHNDEENLQRHLLSIECMKILNEALHLHHERRNCPKAGSLPKSKEDAKEESVITRKFSNFSGNFDAKSDYKSANDSEELAGVIKDGTGIPSSFRLWVLFLCAFSVFGFLVIIFVVHSGRKRKGMKMKHHRTRRRNL